MIGKVRACLYSPTASCFHASNSLFDRGEHITLTNFERVPFKICDAITSVECHFESNDHTMAGLGHVSSSEGLFEDFEAARQFFSNRCGHFRCLALFLVTEDCLFVSVLTCLFVEEVNPELIWKCCWESAPQINSVLVQYFVW